MFFFGVCLNFFSSFCFSFSLDCFVGRRGLDIAGLAVKKHSFGAVNAREPESPMLRKPFSPISSTASSKSNMIEDLAVRNGETVKKTLPTSNLSSITPSKTTSAVEEENRTPRAMPIPVPTTPSTVSVPMQTTMTPAPPPVPFAANQVEQIPEDVEYSFEERRAGFVLPKTHINSMIQV